MEKQVVQQLRALCVDRESQGFIAKDQGCLLGLVGFLDSSDRDVVALAAEALCLLSSNPENIATLGEQPGLKDKLRALQDGVAGKFAQRALEYLTAQTKEEEEEEDIEEDDDEGKEEEKDKENDTGLAGLDGLGLGTVMSENKDVGVCGLRRQIPSHPTTIPHRTTPRPHRMRASVCPAVARRPKTFTLKIVDMESEEDKETVENTVIAVKGVISISMYDQRATIMASCPVKDLVEAVARAGLTASEETEEEWDETRAGGDSPKYLKPTAKPSQEHARKAGTLVTSLEARIAAKKKKKGHGATNNNNGLGGWVKWGLKSLWA